MKKLLICLSLLMLFQAFLSSQDQLKFDDFFLNHTLRIDYYHTGDSHQEFISIEKMYKQGTWAGNPNQLIDHLNNGRYYIKVYDIKSGTLIFSKGFDSYFGEYKTTGLAIKGVKKTFHETALIPYPKNKIHFRIEVRDRKNQLQSLFERQIQPGSLEIHRESLTGGVTVFELVKNGTPHHKVDLAIVAEGYQSKELDKLKRDLNRVVTIFFQQEPYKTFQKSFNISGVFKPSQQSGCDEPRRLIYKNTSISATFNSMGSERYLLTEDNKSLRDIAAHVPYDALLIMINNQRYGGGGIYNFYCTFTIDNQWFPYLLLHEFGHSFAGLADEYYTSATSYNEFYPRGIEPLEPNITTLLNPDAPKWKELLTPGIKIPTPWNKKDFDRMQKEYQQLRKELNQKISRMSRQGFPEARIAKIKEESEKLSRENAKKIDHFLINSPYNGKLGAFMGAGYSSEGLYRPMLDCIMFTKGKKPYCQVCEAAIIRVIKMNAE